MRIAVVGVSGMVGKVMLEVLKEFAFPISEFIPVASEKSVGKQIEFSGKEYTILSHEDALKRKPQIAIFSAGGQASLEWAPKYANSGCYVVDNSSAWRMDKDIPLVVPEINAASIHKDQKIIANPNCSTIQMVLALSPIYKKFGIKRLVISTYQSVTGSGVKGLQQLEQEEKGNIAKNPAYPHPIHRNVIPHGGDFMDDLYTTEEAKLVNETRKIFDDQNIGITATVVRVPVIGGHSEAVNVETQLPFNLDDIHKEMEATSGLTLQDIPTENVYPMPHFSKGKNEVFVGRIRRDTSIENGLNLWIVSDNLRKGAATNAVQIAQYIAQNIL